MIGRCAVGVPMTAGLGTRPPTTRSVLARFALGTAVALVVAIVGGYLALRSVAIDEAKRETRTRVQEAGQLVESSLGDGVLTGRPAAVAALDDVVVGRVLSNSIVRVKLWSADGQVLYSDDPAEIGGRYALDPDQLRLLREGGAEVEVSDLSRPENELDRKQGAPDRGLLPDPHSLGNTGAVRDLPALRLGHRERPSPASSACPADPGRDRVDPARAGCRSSRR